MYQIKSELNKILGAMEDLNNSRSLTCRQLHSQLERAYNIISDSFDLEQCHSVLHILKSQMSELEKCGSGEESTPKVIKAYDICTKELGNFISHL